MWVNIFGIASSKKELARGYFFFGEKTVFTVRLPMIDRVACGRRWRILFDFLFFALIFIRWISVYCMSAVCRIFESSESSNIRKEKHSSHNSLQVVGICWWWSNNDIATTASSWTFAARIQSAVLFIWLKVTWVGIVNANSNNITRRIRLLELDSYCPRGYLQRLIHFLD